MASLYESVSYQAGTESFPIEESQPIRRPLSHLLELSGFTEQGSKLDCAALHRFRRVGQHLNLIFIEVEFSGAALSAGLLVAKGADVDSNSHDFLPLGLLCRFRT